MAFFSGSKQERQQQVNDKEVKAFLEAGCEFVGKLTFSGVVRLNGILKGDVETNDMLIIGEAGIVEGNIRAGALIVAGKITGDITARHRVEVLGTGNIEGTIGSPLLITQEGAQIVAKISVSRPALAS